MFFILLLLSTGRLSFPFFAAYAVSKYGVQAFSDALRREMHPWGIKVSIMEPGGFQTEMAEACARERQIRKGWDDLSDELKKEYGKEYLEEGKRLFSRVKPWSTESKVVESLKIPTCPHIKSNLR